MSEMIDRVATAIWVHAPMSSKNDALRDSLPYLAIVAIEAMQEPTDQMLRDRLPWQVRALLLPLLGAI